jgi:hypothetical protein
MTTTAFLECCAPRWRGVVQQCFADALAEGATDAAAVLQAVQRLAADDLDRATSPGEVTFYGSLLALLAHHQAAARQYAQELLEQQAHAA